MLLKVYIDNLPTLTKTSNSKYEYINVYELIDRFGESWNLTNTRDIVYNNVYSTFAGGLFVPLWCHPVQQAVDW